MTGNVIKIRQQARRDNPDHPAIASVSLKALLAREFPPREIVLAPWLKQRQVGMIWAGPGVGKTWLTMSIALAVAGGGSVWEWSAPKARRVLYIDGEMDVEDLRDRCAALIDMGAVAGIDTEAAGENLVFESRQDQADPARPYWDITRPAHQNLIFQMAKERGFELVILDNLSTVTDGLTDENDAGEAKPVNAFLLKMKAAGIGVILVHHSGKDGSKSRGSSNFDTTLDFKIGLTKVKQSVFVGAEFAMNFDKERGMPSATTSRPSKWQLGDFGWNVTGDEGGRMEKAVELLQSLDYVSLEDIGRALGVAKSTVSKDLTKAAAKGLIAEGRVPQLLAKAKDLREADLAVELEEHHPDTGEGF